MPAAFLYSHWWMYRLLLPLPFCPGHLYVLARYEKH